MNETGNIADVLSGNKAFKIEAEVNDKDLQKAAIYFGAAMLVAVIIANVITRR